VKASPLIFVALVPLLEASAQTPLGRHPIISGDTTGAGCNVRDAAATINQWFVAMSIGDTAAIRSLARPALMIFSAGRHGLPEAFFRADSVEPLVRYVAERHQRHDHWSLIEVKFMAVRGRVLGFMPITRRTSLDPRATQGPWLGKAEYQCGRGVRVMNLAPWPPEVPAYRPTARLPNER
jgi:hypothetical protein